MNTLRGPKLSLAIIACTVAATSGVAVAASTGPAAYPLVSGSLPQGLGYGAVVQGPDGNYYTYATGFYSNSNGAILRITPAGAVTELHDFTGSDGSYPNSLILGSDGSFYGTTYYGGDNADGTVFKITIAGAFSVLHSFGPDITANGGQPEYGLVEGKDGTFYGLAQDGGPDDNGLVFQISSAGAYAAVASPAGVASIFKGSGGSVYYFTGSSLVKIAVDGSQSIVFNACNALPLMQASDGNLYGATDTSIPAYHYSDVARISPDCSSVTVLHTNQAFPAQVVWVPGGWTIMNGHYVWLPGGYKDDPTYVNMDGGNLGSLVQAKDGTIYGTTEAGGVFGTINSGYNVFSIGTDGSYQPLLSFSGPYELGFADGANLMPISLDSSGDLLTGNYRIVPGTPLTTSISFSKSNVNLGQATVLSWSSTNAQSCELVGNVSSVQGSVATGGSKTIRLYSTQNYKPAQFIAGVQCTAADGGISNASASLSLK